MPWVEDPLRPSGWRWERPDADPPTVILPIVPPELPRVAAVLDPTVDLRRL